MKSLQIAFFLGLAFFLSADLVGQAQDHGITDALIDAWIEDLKDDNVRFNAWLAADQLSAYVGCGDEVEARVVRALDSPDYQQRQFAAKVLRYPCPPALYDRLLAVSVEGLQDDMYPTSEHGPWTDFHNAAEGTAYLLHHITAAEPHLVAGLAAGDVQQRFLCAYILACANRQVETPCVVSILCDHLNSNEIGQDACMAASALFRLGPGILPLLREELKTGDDQKRKTLELLIRNLSGPGFATPAELETLQVISRSVPDPTRGYLTGDWGHGAL